MTQLLKKPPFSWYGGKQRMASNLVELLPDHKIYVEPFAGSAALFFKKEPSEIEVLNDTNAELVNFFRVLADEEMGSQLIHKILFTPYSRYEFNTAKDVYKQSVSDPSLFHPVTRARAFFIKYCQSAQRTY